MDEESFYQFIKQLASDKLGKLNEVKLPSTQGRAAQTIPVFYRTPPSKSLAVSLFWLEIAPSAYYQQCKLPASGILKLGEDFLEKRGENVLSLLPLSG